jgi:hypothetical protein
MEFNPDLVAPCGGVICIHDGVCYDCYVKQHPA